MGQGLILVVLFALVSVLTLTRAEEDKKVVCVYNSKAHVREGKEIIDFIETGKIKKF